MEKLQELLKEYQLSKGERVRLAGPDVEVNDREELVLEATLISKKYGFIKWLVENEKIDSGTRNPLFITELVGEQEKQIPYSFYEEMLIRLALSENPIEDLISYLDLSKS